MGERLLLIGGDPDAARLIDRTLGEAEFTLHRVSTGDDAIEYLATNSNRDQLKRTLDLRRLSSRHRLSAFAWLHLPLQKKCDTAASRCDRDAVAERNSPPTPFPSSRGWSNPDW